MYIKFKNNQKSHYLEIYCNVQEHGTIIIENYPSGIPRRPFTSGVKSQIITDYFNCRRILVGRGLKSPEIF